MLTTTRTDDNLPATVLTKLLFQYVTLKPQQAVEEKIQIAAMSELLEEIQEQRHSPRARKFKRLHESQQTGGYGMTEEQKRDCESLAGIASVDACDEQKMTAIMHAAKNRHVLFLKMLLEAKAYVNFQDAVGRTALHWATLERENPCAELLLTFKANPNIADQQQLTPLLQAINNEDTTALFLLSRYGADLNFRGANGNPPLYFTIQHKKYAQLVCLLEMKANTECVNDDKMTPLLSAVCYRDYQATATLLEHHANVNYVQEDKNGKKRTALGYAMKNLSEWNTEFNRYVQDRVWDPSTQRYNKTNDKRKTFPEQPIVDELYLCSLLLKYGYELPVGETLMDCFFHYSNNHEREKEYKFLQYPIRMFNRAQLNSATNEFNKFLKCMVEDNPQQNSLLPFVYLRLAQLLPATEPQENFYFEQIKYYIQAINNFNKYTRSENYIRNKILQDIAVLGNKIENLPYEPEPEIAEVKFHDETQGEVKQEFPKPQQTTVVELKQEITLPKKFSKPFLLEYINPFFWMMTIARMETFTLNTEEWFFLANMFRVYKDNKYVISSIEQARRSQYACQRGWTTTPDGKKEELHESLCTIEKLLSDLPLQEHKNNSSNNAQQKIRQHLLQAIDLFQTIQPDAIKNLLDDLIDSINYSSLPGKEETIERRKELILLRQTSQYQEDTKPLFERILTLIYLDDACQHLREAWKKLPPSPKEQCIPHLSSSLTFFKNQVLEGAKDEIISDLTHSIGEYLDRKEERTELQNVFTKLI